MSSTTLASQTTATVPSDARSPFALRTKSSRIDLSPAPSAIAQAVALLRASGMGPGEWLTFIVIDLLLIGMAFGACFIEFAFNHEVWSWGRQMMNAARGAICAASLMTGCAAMIAALRFAAHDRARAMRGAVLVTLLSGAAFLVVLGLDYQAKVARRLVPGDGFRPSERYVARQFHVRLPSPDELPTVPVAAPADRSARAIDPTHGRELFVGTCATCHGVGGQGMPGQGKDLRTSEFVAKLDDSALFKFLLVGRQPWEPDNTTKVQMPPRGGNPSLKDEDLRDIAAFLHALQNEYRETARPSGQSPPPAKSQLDGHASLPVPTAAALQPNPEIVAHHWVGQSSVTGAPGLSAATRADLARPHWMPPSDADRFFGLFFGVTGLGAAHVLAAMAACGAFWWLSRRGGGPSHHQGGLLLAGAAWYWATAVWLLCFPVLYLC